MDYFTKKNLMIGAVVLVVVVIIIVIVVMVKREKFVLNGNKMVSSSGAGAPPLPTPLTYLTADATGNLSTSADGSFENINATGGVYLNGYRGNVGDVIVSNGPTTPPVWAAGVGLSDFTSSVTANGGYQKLPGGLIIQWGSSGGGWGSSFTTFNFPIPFPTAVCSLSITPNEISGGQAPSGANVIMTTNVTNASFQLNCQVGEAFYWMAIGN